MRAIVGGAALLVGLGAAAHADTMASAPAHGSSAQRVAVCYVYNLSNKVLTVSSVQIVREPAGAILPVTAYNCPAAMTAGAICRSVSDITTADVVACKINISPKSSARAVLEIRDSNNTTLNSQDLR